MKQQKKCQGMSRNIPKVNVWKFQVHRHYDEQSYTFFNSLSANSTKWSNTLKQFVEILPTNFLSVFDHFVGLALKGLRVKKTLVRLSVLILSKLYASKCFCLIPKPFPTNVFMLYPLKTPENQIFSGTFRVV